MNKILSLVVALSAFAFVSGAKADDVKVGVLTCHLSGAEGRLIGAEQKARCVFSGNGHVERYVARFSRTGFDIGVSHRGHLTWAVFAPTSVRHKALRGQYVGATANVALGIGGGANVLVGGNDRTISLQPLSLEAHEGVNLAVGLGALTLY